MNLSQLGEFGLIELLKKYQGDQSSVIKGIGDDTAVVPLNAQQSLLLTTDMLLEGVHFDTTTNPQLIGRKALACSISDIAAMGGLPRYVLVSLGVSPQLSSGFVCGIYKGMEKLARQYGVAIVGGDTIKSDKLVINVALTGEARKKDIVYRNGARTGDQIFVTGPLGKSLSTSWHLKFTPRIKESQYLIRHVKPTSMIDISDGLAGDLGHILEESRVGAVIDEEKIPRRSKATLEQALYDGEDFELFFTVPARMAYSLAKNKNFHHIGEIIAKPKELMVRDKNGNMRGIISHGYRHF